MVAEPGKGRVKIGMNHRFHNAADPPKKTHSSYSAMLCAGYEGLQKWAMGDEPVTKTAADQVSKAHSSQGKIRDHSGQTPSDFAIPGARADLAWRKEEIAPREELKQTFICGLMRKR